ncbi:ubiquinol oxidase subunit II [Thioclava sp. GXIMD4216]|uniref:Ubiquinol oxidase polypeptide II n=1 Tax=Thioclava litoralis TaxID=3076557 RepID=A0ABZ1E2X3_9RHOB|nr:ubiquinol oxidase subunit II [Thioclava sp. FTW29]
MLLAAASLAGCQYEVLAPSGWVAVQERNLLLISTVLMLLIIVPVIVMTVYFPWKYRHDRDDTSDYEPEWAHSTKLEVIVWGAPIIIVAILGVFLAIYTYRLDPYRPLDHTENMGAPVEVEAVSLDWKWLFIYPEQGVASVNELVIPEGRPINMKLSGSTVMNTFWVPALTGMVYSMAGMETQLHFIADTTGDFQSRSAHYSGPGFSKMTFTTHSVTDADFDAWVEKAKAQGQPLTRASYLQLEQPSIAAPISYYNSVEDNLFNRIVGLCVEENKVCMNEMMMLDMHRDMMPKAEEDDKSSEGEHGQIGLPKQLFEYDMERSIDGHGNLISLPADTSEEHMSALDARKLMAQVALSADGLCLPNQEYKTNVN